MSIEKVQERFNEYRRKILEGEDIPPSEYAELVDLLRTEHEKSMLNKARRTKIKPKGDEQ